MEEDLLFDDLFPDLDDRDFGIKDVEKFKNSIVDSIKDSAFSLYGDDTDDDTYVVDENISSTLDKLYCTVGVSNNTNDATSSCSGYSSGTTSSCSYGCSSVTYVANNNSNEDEKVNKESEDGNTPIMKEPRLEWDDRLNDYVDRSPCYTAMLERCYKRSYRSYRFQYYFTLFIAAINAFCIIFHLYAKNYFLVGLFVALFVVDLKLNMSTLKTRKKDYQDSYIDIYKKNNL